MVNPHVAVGIAQVVFYVPMAPVTLYVLIKNWPYPPRMAWYPLVTFSILRIAGGILAIVRGDDTNNTALIITEIVILGVGTVPLIVSLIGLVRIIFIMSLAATSRANHLLRLLRAMFVASVIMLIAGGALNSNESTETTGRNLNRAAYILLAVLVVFAAACLVYLLTRRSHVPPQGLHYIYFCLLASPFIAVRVAYGILGSFSSIDSKWDPVFGSPAIFAIMGLLMEFIALCIFVYLGFYAIRHHLDGTHVPGRSDSPFWRRRRRLNRLRRLGWGGSNAEDEQRGREDTKKPAA